MFYLTSGDTGVLSCNHFNYSPPKFLLDFLLAGFPLIIVTKNSADINVCAIIAFISIIINYFYSNSVSRVVWLVEIRTATLKFHMQLIPILQL